MPATFYILFSATLDRYYIGHTEDRLDGRIRRHNSDHKGFTGKARDWTPVFTEEFPSKIEAYARERQVKAWKSRTAIERLVSEKKARHRQHGPSIPTSVGRVTGTNPVTPTTSL